MRIWWPILILLLAQGGALGDGSRVTALGKNLLVVALTESAPTAAHQLPVQTASASTPRRNLTIAMRSVSLPAPDEALVGSVVPRAGP
ncbi:MAG: hypothetical protein KF812_13230, partial [Fimbriimonadaceae bacterium]|nr:hypothetical protein [Fimbriimonadaceae bacterium]